MSKRYQKSKLLAMAYKPMQEFCSKNKINVPDIKVYMEVDWAISSCAYYRNNIINICPRLCASPGYGGKQWSWPGGPIDRTPYGVIQHEFGHHVDIWSSTRRTRDRYFGDFSKKAREFVKEEPLTNYCPNDAEWFAEMFRLFMTNPDLLGLLRPGTYSYLRKHFVPVINKPWKEVLSDAPERTLKMVINKITKVQKSRQQRTLF